MRIIALVKSLDHVCCRYRIAAFRSAFEQMGEHFDIQPWSARWFVQQLLPHKDTDVLIVQRKLFPRWQLNWLRRRVRKLVYDFDDAIFLNSSYNPGGQDCPRRLQQFKDMLHAADVVIAGNRFLREQAMCFTDPHKVHLIPTCVDVRHYDLARDQGDAERHATMWHNAPPCGSGQTPVQLTWIGSSSTLRGLERIRGLLESVGKEIPRLELKIICNRSLSLSHLPVRFAQWEETTETTELAGADIGISWLPDDSWSEGKCGLKVLQYMAAGLPVVANPVGVHKTMVRHGETGFLVETQDDWLEAIRWLACDPELRRTMGQAGRRLVEAGYDVSVGAACWRRVLGTVSGCLAQSA